jgi:hypothetical protein
LKSKEIKQEYLKFANQEKEMEIIIIIIIIIISIFVEDLGSSSSSFIKLKMELHHHGVYHPSLDTQLNQILYRVNGILYNDKKKKGHQRIAGDSHCYLLLFLFFFNFNHHFLFYLS